MNTTTPRTNRAAATVPSSVNDGADILIKECKKLERELQLVTQQHDATIDSLVQTRRELSAAHTRLEDNFCFDSQGNRIEVAAGSIPDGISCRDETIKMQDARIAELSAARRWIPVEEGLPEEEMLLETDGAVLAKYFMGGYGVLTGSAIRNFYKSAERDGDVCCITCWQLIEPPKESTT